MKIGNDIANPISKNTVVKIVFPHGVDADHLEFGGQTMFRFRIHADGTILFDFDQIGEFLCRVEQNLTADTHPPAVSHIDADDHFIGPQTDLACLEGFFKIQMFLQPFLVHSNL